MHNAHFKLHNISQTGERLSVLAGLTYTEATVTRTKSWIGSVQCQSVTLLTVLHDNSVRSNGRLPVQLSQVHDCEIYTAMRYLIELGDAKLTKCHIQIYKK